MQVELVPDVAVYMGEVLPVCRASDCPGSCMKVDCTCLVLPAGRANPAAPMGGVAVFTGLAISHPGGGYQLRVSRCPLGTKLETKAQCSLSLLTATFMVHNTRLSSLLLDPATPVPRLQLAGTPQRWLVWAIDRCGYTYATDAVLVAPSVAQSTANRTSPYWASPLGGSVDFPAVRTTAADEWSVTFSSLVYGLLSASLVNVTSIPRPMRVLHGLPAGFRRLLPGALRTLSDGAPFNLTLQLVDAYGNAVRAPPAGPLCMPTLYASALYVPT